MNTGEITKILKSGAVGVLATDTLYGLVGSALNPETVEKIYELKQRNKNKPLIILISEIGDLEIFDVKLTSELKQKLREFWPGPVSVILPCSSEKFKYLHRGGNSLAFRLPNKPDLINLLKQTGPLVAPSANLENKRPAETVAEAKEYFGEQITFYQDSGKLSGKASIIVSLLEKESKIVRE